MTPIPSHRLRQLRLEAGFETQEALALKLCCTREAVNRWERGRRQVPIAVGQLLEVLARQRANPMPKGGA
jgi:DNA-binding transcriptional regulator YiaG